MGVGSKQGLLDDSGKKKINFRWPHRKQVNQQISSLFSLNFVLYQHNQINIVRTGDTSFFSFEILPPQNFPVPP
jgi:hypothetical protein